MRKEHAIAQVTSTDDLLLISVDEAARRFGIGKSTLYRKIKQGLLPVVDLAGMRRIDPRDMQSCIAENKWIGNKKVSVKMSMAKRVLSPL